MTYEKSFILSKITTTASWKALSTITKRTSGYGTEKAMVELLQIHPYRK